MLNKEQGGVCVPAGNKCPTGIKGAEKQDVELTMTQIYYIYI